MAERSVVPLVAVRPNSVYWGAVLGNQFTGTAAPYDMASEQDFVSQDAAGKGASIIPMYQGLMDCSTKPCAPIAFPDTEFSAVRRYGAIPMVSWGTSSLQDPSYDGITDADFTLSDVLKGYFDPFIRQWAQSAKAWGHPFFLRFDWEMNGDWFTWGNATNNNTASEYRQVWRHVHQIFTQVGATNATWVWCPNNGNQNGSIADLASFYPGNAYVNWTCMDAYNTGTDSWNKIAKPTYDAITEKIAPTKPFMVGEFSSDADGGAQANWMANALAEIPRLYKKIHAIILYDTGGSTPWTLDDEASAKAFARGIRGAAYVSNHVGGLRGPEIRAR